MATDTERLEVLIEANTRGYQNAMEKLQSQTTKALSASETSVKGLDARLAALQGTVTKVGAVFGIAFGARALVEFIKNGVDAGATIADMAAKLGITTTAYQELTFVASQTGANQEDVNTAFKGMIKVLGQAADGSKTAQDDLAKLGITFDTIKGQSPDKVFELILNSLSKIHDPLQRGAIELQIFGKSGLQLGEMAQVGATGIDALIQKAHDVGYVLSDETIQKAKEAADELKLIGDVGSAAGIALASDFKPAIDAIAKLITSPEFQQGLDKTATQLGAIVKFMVEHPELLAALGGAAIGSRFGGLAGAAVGAAGGAIMYDVNNPNGPSRTGRMVDGKLVWDGPPAGDTSNVPSVTVGAASTGGSSGTGGGWDQTPEQKAQAAAYDKLAKSIQLQTANLTASDREQFISNEVAKLGVKATQQQIDGITAFAGVLFDTTKKQQAFNDAAKFFSDSVGNEFISFITGAESANDALKHLLTTMVEAVLQAELLGEGPLAGILGTAPSKSGAPAGILGSLLSGLFGHAGGGTVSGNRPVLVGERGPELFIPNTSGRIARDANDNGGTITVRIVSDASPMLTQQIDVRSTTNAVKVVSAAAKQQARARQRGG